MSFIMNESGKTYAPGYFLAHEECRRETREIAQASATTAANGGKYVKMGTIFPSNDANAIGIVYEDVDVSSGAMGTAGTISLGVQDILSGGHVVASSVIGGTQNIQSGGYGSISAMTKLLQFASVFPFSKIYFPFSSPSRA